MCVISVFVSVEVKVWVTQVVVITLKAQYFYPYFSSILISIQSKQFINTYSFNSPFLNIKEAAELQGHCILEYAPILGAKSERKRHSATGDARRNIQHPAKHNPLKPQLETLTCAHTKLSTSKPSWAAYYRSSIAWTKKPILWGVIQLSNQKIPHLIW